MRNFLLTLLLTFSKIFVHQTQAQEKIAVIEKNSNILAKDVKHELNATKDTLILRSKRRMHYVYSVNSDHQREIDEFIEDFKYKIPIDRLSQGKHLFAVSYLQRKIVFIVRVYDPKASFKVSKRGEDVATRNN
ncbi:MAG: hypothetical protein KJO41_11630 [Bacteroidia bacterium]|nr:hypothetical protein [Bacteroidia bacterium]NND25348.1 hypothetical protein [Flavobacteriaceae bacterium]MBT8279648.1 hypothetical protein [Bacteroidia bacterium]NNK60305.1 hypothetical protein [Flavobacteriaceae bacterium]NNL33913.1 hypothetical protein [Flavobacteriaceae bacterium]